MRIRVKDCILLCDIVVYSKGNKLISASAQNRIYNILFITPEDAENAYNQLLEKGYYDAYDNEINWDIR